MSSTISPIVEDKLLVLSNTYELDGRATSHPVDARGYAPMQCYLLKEAESALLVGTGLTVHQEQVLGQIDSLLDSQRLSIMPLGFDFTGLCNARPIADRFGIQYVYQSPLVDIPPAWLNFRPEFPDDETDGLKASEPYLMKTGEPIQLDPAGGRQLDLLVPAMRLLPNQWLYDVATKTMFTVDVFTWAWRQDDEGPWVIGEDDDDPTTLDALEQVLLNNRYWWLAGAETERIRRALADVFERYEIENIAPEYGCALKGTSVVNRHFELFDELLRSAASRPAKGVEVGKWTFAGAR
jgi:hypothetical protein